MVREARSCDATIGDADGHRILPRRRLIRLGGFASAGLALLACAPPAPPPTAATAAPTVPTAPAPPPKAPTATAPPSPRAAAGAPTPAPAQKAPRTFPPASARVLSTSGAVQGVVRTLVEKRGYYREFGLQVQREELADGNRVLAATVAGEADLADAGIGPVFPAIIQGGDLKLLGVHYSLAAYFFYATGEVKSLKDLEGKAVGASAPGSLTHVLASAVLRKAGLDLSKVTFVTIGGSPAVFQAVAARKVDAGVSQISFQQVAKEQGVQILGEVWKLVPDYVSTGFFASQKTIAQRRDVLVRLLAAYAKTFAFVKTPESKNAWVDVGINDYKLNPKDTEADWEWTREHGALAYDLALTPTQVTFMQQVNVDLGLQQEILPYDRVVDMSIARDALALLKS